MDLVFYIFSSSCHIILMWCIIIIIINIIWLTGSPVWAFIFFLSKKANQMSGKIPLNCQTLFLYWNLFKSINYNFRKKKVEFILLYTTDGGGKCWIIYILTYECWAWKLKMNIFSILSNDHEHWSHIVLFSIQWNTRFFFQD